MKNESLHEIYNIPFTSEWKHRNGENYMVFDLQHITSGGLEIPIVVYSKILTTEESILFIENEINNQSVATVEHFKSNFEQVASQVL